ncbi:MAG: EF-hand domain-containing protein [Planctomycetota bacterium]|nr:EF-hand domain-containing protein [Planctomycetota bacterium]
MKKSLMIAMLAGVAATPALAADALPIKKLGHIYINMKTGERQMTPYYTDRAGPDIWNNDDSGVCGNFFYGVDRPTRATTDPRPRFGGGVFNTGDIAGAVGVGTTIDGVGFGTASVGILSTDTVNHATAGFDYIVSFYDNDNGGTTPDTGAAALFILTVGDVPGEEGTGNAWTFSVDLAGGNEFVLGDQDIDGDGKLDFGWGYNLVQNQSLTDGINSAKGIAGPFLVAPGGFTNELGVASTSTSTVTRNSIHWYSSVTFDSTGGVQPRTSQSFVGNYGFGTATSANPYSSTYLVLAGPAAACPADFNGDGFIDFTDFDVFVFAFESGDPSSDFNQDGFLDFTDFDEFVAAFELGC